MFRVATAALPEGVPGVIGQVDGSAVLLLDEQQMERMPWDERIRICNELIGADMGDGSHLAPTPAVEVIEPSRVVQIGSRLPRGFCTDTQVAI